MLNLKTINIMIKQKIVIVFLAFFSLFSCQSSERIHNKFLKKAESFRTTNFPGIYFDKLYIMEGTYITKGKFNIIPPKLEISRGSDTKHYDDYLVFNSNGTVEKFYAENALKAKQLLVRRTGSAIYGVLYLQRSRLIIEVIQAFKMGGGYGSYKQEVKIEGDKILVQDGEQCSVYLLGENL